MCRRRSGVLHGSDGNATDTEMLRAAAERRDDRRPAAHVVVALRSIGCAWDSFRQHYGQADSSTFVWQSSAPEMNPLPRDYLARMERDDPEAYRSEVLGEFRAGSEHAARSGSARGVRRHGAARTSAGGGGFLSRLR